MKLDPKHIRHLTPEDWRVLTAVEQGSRNHLVVPTSLIVSLTNARGGSQISKSISTLAKSSLISKVKNASYDGYRLAYGGLDYLALHAHMKAGAIYSIGNQIGVGKESDIYVVASPTGRRLVLKIHRLGRTSFRTVKNNREYLKKGGSGSWMYMSTLAARKEWTFMRALRESGFAVPEPVAWNRHTVVMELIDAFPLRQISTVPQPEKLYGELIEITLRLARFGLIHADFNEFNLLIEEREAHSNKLDTLETTEEQLPQDSEMLPDLILKPVVIDFPQALSIDHPNAEFYFNRDVQCIKTFFERRFHFVSDEPGPFFEDAVKTVGLGEGVRRLDVEVEASGFSKKMAKELEKYMTEHGVDGDAGTGDDRDEDYRSEDEDIKDANAEGSYDSAALAVRDKSEDEAAIEKLTILQLTDENVNSSAHEDFATPQPRPQPAFDTVSLAGTMRGNKKPVNIAKAAKGWAI